MNMVDYLVILLRKKKLIVVNTLIVFIVSILISLLMTKWFKSTALIMPPVKEGLGFDLSTLNIPFAGALGTDESILKYLTILKSRTLRERMIKEFNLMEKYREEYMEEALETFGNNVDIDVTEEGAIALTVYDEDPVKARDMVIRYYKLLDSTYTVLAVERAANNRMFLETRVDDTQKRLREAEEQLRDLQFKTGVLVIPEQVASGIEFVASLEAKILQLEIQLNYLEKLVDKNSFQYRQVQLELAEYQKTIKELQNGGKKGNNLVSLPPLSEIPDITLEYYRRYRDVQIYNKILEFVLPQYEKARLEEAKDIPAVQLLDYPQVAEKKAKPKRAFVVLAITFLFLILLCTYIITTERIKKLAETNPERYQKIRFILSNLNPFRLRTKNPTS
jgi:capsule polysaccharide export protein KpsE/RkpR